MGNPYINDLVAVEDALFVVELISKTRDNGLPWVAVAPDLYTITLCDPSECLVPSVPAESWNLFVRRNQANYNPLPYVYYLEVLVDGEPYMSIDSRQTNFVEKLFRAIEIYSVPPCDWRVEQAIDFISVVPTSPSSEIVHFVMCGGVDLGGAARVYVHYRPKLIPAGSVAATTSARTLLVMRPPAATNGTTVEGTSPEAMLFSGRSSATNAAEMAAIGVADRAAVAELVTEADLAATGA